MKIQSLLYLAFFFAVSALIGAEDGKDLYRTWTSQSGHEVDALLVEVIGDEVTLKRKDGQVIHFSVDVLIYSDQAFLREWNLTQVVNQSSGGTGSVNDSLDRYLDLGDAAKQARRVAGMRSIGICIIKNYKIYGIGYASREGDEAGNRALKSQQVSIASCTKAINATLAAICVSRGKIEWDTRLVEVFPELSKTMERRYRSVTLEQLLNHTAGAPSMDKFWKSKDYLEFDKSIGSPRDQRYELLKVVTRSDPSFKPGTDFEYSNAGHYIAGSMLERVMGGNWELLVEELILKPLEMADSTTTRGVNPQLTAPAGGVVSTLEDYAKFCIFHLQFKADNVLGIKKEDFEFMHEASNIHHYGLGFFTVSTEWSKGTTLQHHGRNQQFASTFWIAPEEGFGVFAITPGQYANSDFWDDAIPFLIDKFL